MARSARERGLVYHFLSAVHAKKDLAERRIKVSKLDELNDPFEALGCSLPTREDRKKFRAIKAHINDEFGLVCFSEGWGNPLLWSHYGDRHKGMCLGFSVPEDALIKVRYTKSRDQLTPELLAKEDCHRLLLSRKFRDWAYEEEHRMLLPLRDLDEEDSLYYKPFGRGLKLKEIIVGPMCVATEVELRSLLRPPDPDILIIKSRVAFNTYRVVENLQGFRTQDSRRPTRTRNATTSAPTKTLKHCTLKRSASSPNATSS